LGKLLEHALASEQTYEAELKAAEARVVEQQEWIDRIAELNTEMATATEAAEARVAELEVERRLLSEANLEVTNVKRAAEARVVAAEAERDEALNDRDVLGREHDHELQARMAAERERDEARRVLEAIADAPDGEPVDGRQVARAWLAAVQVPAEPPTGGAQTATSLPGVSAPVPTLGVPAEPPREWDGVVEKVLSTEPPREEDA
jgi:hypothetical protein